MKTSLVIGGSGSLGSAIIKKLKETHKIINLDFNENLNSHHNLLSSGSKLNKEKVLNTLKQKFGIVLIYRNKSTFFSNLCCRRLGW